MKKNFKNIAKRQIYPQQIFLKMWKMYQDIDENITTIFLFCSISFLTVFRSCYLVQL